MFNSRKTVERFKSYSLALQSRISIKLSVLSATRQARFVGQLLPKKPTETELKLKNCIPASTGADKGDII
jgi:hypothetical protein